MTGHAHALPAPYRPTDLVQGGPLIVIEGISGSGKSTLVRLLREKLTATEVHTLPEPHRQLSPLVNAQTRALPQLAFYLSGLLHASDVIRAGLERGPVIADRYLTSVLANHAAVNDVPLADVIAFVTPFRPYLVQPQRTVYLKVSPSVLRARLTGKPDYTASDHDVLHVPGQLERILAHYDALAAEDPTAVVLDADQPTPDQLAATILALLEHTRA